MKVSWSARVLQTAGRVSGDSLDPGGTTVRATLPLLESGANDSALTEVAS